MYCPFCGHQETKVVDSRLAETDIKPEEEENAWNAAKGLPHMNRQELLLPKLIKETNQENFNESKLRSGILVATEKRPISSESIEELISRIIRKVQKLGKREIQSRILGECHA